jgi:hypothetical protein
MTNEELALFVGHPDRIVIARLGSGYAALHMRYYDDIEGYDVCQTGYGRYHTRAEAIKEAKAWSKSDEIELKL